MAEGEPGGGLIPAWRLAGRLLAPLAPRYLARRVRRGKEDAARVSEKTGAASAPRPEGPLVWVHAASVGEVMAAAPLVERLAASGFGVLVTTVTVAGAGFAAGRLPAHAVHQYAPLDLASFIGRFLDHWWPDAALFVESELWPVTLDALARRGVPTVVVNARMSPRSFRGWRRAGRLARPMFARLTLVLAQSQADAERFAALGTPRVEVTGNLKFDAAPLIADADALAAFESPIAGRPVWLAASTHPGEEKIVAGVHAELARDWPDLLTVIAPRHPQRGAEVARTVKAIVRAGVALRSKGTLPDAETAIYVADTFDEMGLLYRLVQIVFLGGSLARIGGHNPLEALRLDCALISGPHTDKLDEVYAALLDAGAIRRVEGRASLAAAVRRLLADPARAAEQARRGRLFLDRAPDPLERTMSALAPLLPATPAAPTREPPLVEVASDAPPAPEAPPAERAK